MPKEQRAFDLSEAIHQLIYSVLDMLFVKLWFIWPVLLVVAYLQNRLNRMGRR